MQQVHRINHLNGPYDWDPRLKYNPEGEGVLEVTHYVRSNDTEHLVIVWAGNKWCGIYTGNHSAPVIVTEDRWGDVFTSVEEKAVAA